MPQVHDIHLSSHVLDLSSSSKSEGCFGIASGAEESLPNIKGREQKRIKFAYGKIVAVLVVAVTIGASVFGINAWKELSKLKSASLSANAMSEENIQTIEKILGVIQYLPATGEAKKIKELAADFESFKSILGFDRSKKYLLVFQNPSEMRATGGFIGSVGVLEMDAGKVKSVKFQDVYDLDGQLDVYVEPPWPIKKISAAWSLHDSNWFFDFPSSAEEISRFYEKGGGETMDGIIALNPKVIEDILKITGPIKLEENGQELNEKNFVEITQEEVELKYDKTINRPKTFLADLMAKMKETVESLPLDKKIAIMKNLIANLDEKDIQAVFRDQSAQSFTRSHNWDGRVNGTGADYLAVVHSNINGFKTDAVTDEAISLNTDISPDGTVIDTFSVTRTHAGTVSDEEWYNKVNSDYLRLYLPSGAELLSTKGVTKEFPFLKNSAADYSEYLKDDKLQQIEKNKVIDAANGVEIFEESGKTVFGSWVYVSPGEKVTVSWQYRLPFRVEFDANTHTGVYSLLAQKQSGSRAGQLKQKITFPADWKVLGNYSEDFTLMKGRIERALNVETDKFAPVLFQVPAPAKK